MTFGCTIGDFTSPVNLELVISQPEQILEWTGCASYLEGWTSLLPQQQAEGNPTLSAQTEGMSMLFSGTPKFSHPVPAVNEFLHKEPVAAADIEKTH